MTTVSGSAGHKGRDKEQRSLMWLRVVVSSGALLVAMARFIWPDIVIDANTVALIVIAILPWLAPVVKSIKLPSGLTIELRELKSLESRAQSTGLLAPRRSSFDKTLSPPPPGYREEVLLQAVTQRDAHLGLAGLAYEIERKLLQLAEVRGIAPGRREGMGQLLHALAETGVLSHDERAVLADMTSLLSAAAHGATLDVGAGNWAVDVGPRLLESLDDRIAKAGNLTSASG